MKKVNVSGLSAFLVECGGCGKKHLPLSELYGSKSFCIKCKDSIAKDAVTGEYEPKRKMKFFKAQGVYILSPEDRHVRASFLSRCHLFTGGLNYGYDDNLKPVKKAGTGKWATVKEFEDAGYIRLHTGDYCLEEDTTMYHGIVYPKDGLAQYLFDAGKLINNYSFKPTPEFQKTTEKEHTFRTKKGATIKRGIPYLGVEVELEFRGESKTNKAMELFKLYQEFGLENHFYMKDDSSMDNGIETVSHPATLSWWKTQDVKNLFKGIESLGGKAENTCGMHVHVSRDALTKKEWWTLMSFMSKASRKIIKLSRRSEFEYCQFNNKGVSDALMLGKGIFTTPVHEGTRSLAVNFENSNTVEFRLFKATTDNVEFLGSLSFVEALVEFAKTYSFMYVQEAKSSELWNEFVRFSSLKGYGSLIKLMVELGIVSKKPSKSKKVCV